MKMWKILGAISLLCLPIGNADALLLRFDFTSTVDYTIGNGVDGVVQGDPIYGFYEFETDITGTYFSGSNYMVYFQPSYTNWSVTTQVRTWTGTLRDIGIVEDSINISNERYEVRGGTSQDRSKQFLFLQDTNDQSYITSKNIPLEPLQIFPSQVMFSIKDISHPQGGHGFRSSLNSYYIHEDAPNNIPNAIPEPLSLILFGGGLLSLIRSRRKIT